MGSRTLVEQRWFANALPLPTTKENIDTSFLAAKAVNTKRTRWGGRISLHGDHSLPPASCPTRHSQIT